MPSRTSQTVLAVAAGAAGWALLPPGALGPVVAAGGAVLVLKIKVAKHEVDVPRARLVPPKSLWAGWDLSGQGGGDTVAVYGGRTLWQVGDEYVIEQDGVFRPVSILSARQLTGVSKFS